MWSRARHVLATAKALPAPGRVEPAIMTCLSQSGAKSTPGVTHSLSGRTDKTGDTMASPEAAQLAIRLDQDHLPETNGRMAVCRRCGSRVDSPSGHHHAPSEGQLVRSDQWLDAQARLRRIDRERNRRSNL